MNRKIRKLLSLATFTKHPAHMKGQIATFLLLLMVAVLIFVMFTANLGTLSLTATTVANAADASGLGLGSQLATRANVILAALNDPDDPKSTWKAEACRRTGLWKVFVIAAAVAIAFFSFGIASPVSLGMIGAVTGATAGAAAAIDESRWGAAASGAIQGFTIGYMFGQGAGMIQAGMGDITAAANYSAMTGIDAHAVGAGTAILHGAVTLGGGVGGGLYEQHTLDAKMADLFKVTAKQLEGLPEYERTRESTFLQALSQTVDDPTMVVDATDVNRNGNVTERVPAFSVWWDQRIRRLKAQAAAGTASRVSTFLQDTLLPLKEAVKQLLVELHRKEIECGCAGVDGRLVELYRALDRDGFATGFWQPGPNKAEWLDLMTCRQCASTPPAGYDEVDQAHSKYEQFLEFACTLLDPRGEDSTCRDLGAPPFTPSGPPPPGSDDEEQSYDVIGTWRNWLPTLYNPTATCAPNTTCDFYHVLNVMTNGENGSPDQTTIPDEDGKPKTVWGTCGSSGFKGLCGWDVKGTLRINLPRCQLAYGSYQTKTTELVNPLTNSCSSDPRLPYSCPWQESVSNATGTYLRPPTPGKSCCRLREGGGGGDSGPGGQDYVQLTTQINAVRTFVNPNNLNAFLAQRVSQPDPCPNEAGPGWSLVQGSVDITVKRLALADDTLSYAFDYSYTCRQCAGTPPLCQDKGQSGSRQETRSNMGAPDLTIPTITANVWDGVRGVLDDFADTLDRVRTGPHGNKFATIDQDTNEEFRTEFDIVSGYHDEIDQRLVELRQFAQSMPITGQTGAGSVRYDWTDSRCPSSQKCHAVTVETGPFKLPRTEEEERGNWFWGSECQVLKDYTEDGSRAWVKVTREEPSNIAGNFWKWNPFSGRITKKCSVSYGFDRNWDMQLKIKWK